jgi:hypothetical protein
MEVQSEAVVQFRYGTTTDKKVWGRESGEADDLRAYDSLNFEF